MFISDGEPWDADEFMAKLSGLMQACPRMQLLGQVWDSMTLKAMPDGLSQPLTTQDFSRVLSTTSFRFEQALPAYCLEA